MKTIYHVYSDSDGEIEGMFDADGNMLGAWCCNDGLWRGEYFDPFLRKLGIEVKYDATGECEEFKGLRRKLEAALGG